MKIYYCVPLCNGGITTYNHYSKYHNYHLYHHYDVTAYDSP